jgi:hypothetical protein
VGIGALIKFNFKFLAISDGDPIKKYTQRMGFTYFIYTFYHLVMVTLDAEKPPSVQGGPLNGVYEFAQFHFHWGRSDQEGDF